MTDWYNPRDLKYQPKADLNKIMDYIRAIDKGQQLPPVQIKRLPNGGLRVVDGTHRCWAHMVLGLEVEGYIQDEN